MDHVLAIEVVGKDIRSEFRCTPGHSAIAPGQVSPNIFKVTPHFRPIVFEHVRRADLEHSPHRPHVELDAALIISGDEPDQALWVMGGGPIAAFTSVSALWDRLASAFTRTKIGSIV